MKADFALFRVGDVWHFRFRLDGKRVQRSTKETVYAKAKAAARDAWEAAKTRARGDEPEPTLGALVGLWAQAHTLSVSPSHLDGVERVGKLHLFDLADLPLRELSTARVEDARAQFLAAGHARGSANHWLTVIRLLVRWAISRRMLREMPFSLRKLKVQRRPKVLLPVAKAAAWVAEVDRLTPDDLGLSLVVRVIIGTGLRVNEAVLARWEWMDWDRRLYTPGQTKGFEAWPRPVPPWLLQELATLRQASGFIIPTRPGHPITDRRVREVMLKANKALGLGHVTPHRLRGTYATLLHEAMVPIKAIQRALGHKSILTTEGYIEVDLDRVAKGQLILADQLQIPGRGIGEPTSAKAHPQRVCPFCGEISGLEAR